MNEASDYRSIARDVLAGRWGIAVIAGLLASLLGAVAAVGPDLEFHLSEHGAGIDLMYANQLVFSTSEGWVPGMNAFLLGGVFYVMAAALVMAAVYFVLGSVISLGYAGFNLDLVDGRGEAQIGTLFTYFPHWKTAAIARIRQTILVLLWSLLFIIPGIMAAYSYAMTSYILAEHPDMLPGDAIARSRELMAGNRWRLFCLGFSFIGWDILSAMTMGIGGLWLTPYKQAAIAAFYRDLCRNR